MQPDDLYRPRRSWIYWGFTWEDAASLRNRFGEILWGRVFDTKALTTRMMVRVQEMEDRAVTDPACAVSTFLDEQGCAPVLLCALLRAELRGSILVPGRWVDGVQVMPLPHFAGEAGWHLIRAACAGRGTWWRRCAPVLTVRQAAQLLRLDPVEPIVSRPAGRNLTPLQAPWWFARAPVADQDALTRMAARLWSKPGLSALAHVAADRGVFAVDQTAWVLAWAATAVRLGWVPGSLGHAAEAVGCGVLPLAQVVHGPMVLVRAPTGAS